MLHRERGVAHCKKRSARDAPPGRADKATPDEVVIASSAPSSSPSPLDETGLPLFRTLKPLSEDDQASSPLFSIRMLSSHINMITVCFLLAQRSNPGAA